MDLRELELPPAVARHYESRGIEQLYPPQRQAIDAGLLTGKNLVAAVPTAGGKTLLAELAMLTASGPALYIVPLRALASEKYGEFSALPNHTVGITTGDFETAKADLADKDIIVATSERVDSLIRHGVSWLDDLGCIVVDEIHLLHSRERGPTLEVTIAKLRSRDPTLQIVGLSATVANPEAIADWLDAALVESPWRPIQLHKGTYYDGRISFEDRTEAIDPGGREPTTALIRDSVADGGQCLAFVHSRRAAEELASAFSAEWLGSSSQLAGELSTTATTATGDRLAEVAQSGVAFHHAGLKPAHRALVESSFRDRELDVICATPTLAAGVNIPARRVIVRDTFRYTDQGRQPLPVLEVHQMCGRAGRPGLDPFGEAILVADSADDCAELTDRYIHGEPEAVESKLARQEALRTHVLATVASGFAETRSDLIGVLDETFYAASQDPAALVDIADLLIDYLTGAGMLAEADGLVATELGHTVSELYIDPETGAELVTGLSEARERADVSMLTILELVCSTPDMAAFYLKDGEWSELTRFAEHHEATFTSSFESVTGEFGEWLAVLKTVRVLADWIQGVGEGTITERYGIGPGDLRTKLERAVWLLNAAESIARLQDNPIGETVSETRVKLEDREP